MKFKTSLTNLTESSQQIRSHKLSDLVSEHGFVSAIFLLLNGNLPDEKEYRMFDAIFTSIIDHGPGTASAMNARISASSKNPLHASVAAGLLGLGDRHGTTIEAAMNFFYEHKDVEDVEALLKEMKEKKQYVMGYGHKVFREADPRAEMLFGLAKELGIYGAHCELAQKVQETLNAISSRKLPINCDGAIAAILCDMGFDSVAGNGIFVIGRVPGLVAHVVEERNNDEGIRRAPLEDIEFNV